MTRPSFNPNQSVPDVSRLSERAYHAETESVASLLDQVGLTAAQTASFVESRAARLIDRVGEKLEPASFDDVVTAIPHQQTAEMATRLRDAVEAADAHSLTMPLVDAARDVEHNVTQLLAKLGHEQ